MPVISFQKQFVNPILTETKKTTIRKIGGRTYKVGNILYMYQGRYTPTERKKIGEATISSVDSIKIYTLVDEDYIELTDIIVNGESWTKKMDESESPQSDIEFLKMARLITDDGFEDNDEFIYFFHKQGQQKIKTKEGVVSRFNGVLIRWENFTPAEGLCQEENQ